MSDIKKTLEDYPEISFIEDLTLDELMEQMIADYKEKYKEETKKEASLPAADPNRLILYAAALQIYQAFQYLDNAGKQSFLKYSYGGFLDNLGALKGIYRNEGGQASAQVRFTVSEKRESAIIIPSGTRITAGDNIFFFTTEEAEIPAGMEYIDVPVKCTEYGIAGNGYEAGKINVLVDPINYIGSVANTITSDGGAAAESDEQLAERIYLAPSSYSTAGPDEAYIYWTKTCNAGISDVMVSSPSDGVVDIRFVMQGGEIPEKAVVNEVSEFLNAKTRRPLTDKVEIGPPEVVEYSVDLTYWINESDKAQAAAIQEKVVQAVNAYKMWQMEVIGRDINPSKLVSLIMTAGAKRVMVRSPDFQVIQPTSIAKVQIENVIYGGIESD